MPIKRKSSFIGAVISIWDAREKEGLDITYWHEALQVALVGEFVNLGIPEFYLNEMLDNEEKPGEDWIKYCIERASASDEALEPLSTQAYEMCYWLLRVLRSSEQTMNADDKETLSSEYWLSIGVGLGLKSKLVG